MTVQAGSLVARGREAMTEGRWADARDAFVSALSLGEDPDATFGLAVAWWWSGETDRALRGWERAFVLYRRARRSPGAVMAPFYLCLVPDDVRKRVRGPRLAGTGRTDLCGTRRRGQRGLGRHRACPPGDRRGPSGGR